MRQLSAWTSEVNTRREKLVAPMTLRKTSAAPTTLAFGKRPGPSERSAGEVAVPLTKKSGANRRRPVVNRALGRDLAGGRLASICLAGQTRPRRAELPRHHDRPRPVGKELRNSRRVCTWCPAGVSCVRRPCRATNRYKIGPNLAGVLASRRHFHRVFGKHDGNRGQLSQEWLRAGAQRRGAALSYLPARNR
jgi:hypothetical protein